MKNIKIKVTILIILILFTVFLYNTSIHLPLLLENNIFISDNTQIFYIELAIYYIIPILNLLITVAVLIYFIKSIIKKNEIPPFKFFILAVLAILINIIGIYLSSGIIIGAIS